MKSSAPASMAFVFSWPMLEVTMITGSIAVASFRGARANGVAVEAGHHHVQEDQVGIFGLDELEARVPSFGATTW